MTQNKDNLIWIDLEMTGLDTFNDQIIEIATVITDKELNILAEGPVIAVHQPQTLIDSMDEWNTNQHGKSGLIERVQKSDYNEERAELETIDFLETFVPKGASPMCGNSICQDRRFLGRCMPRLEDFFHYRNLDVSSLKELTQRWSPEILNQFSKKGAHLALDDILESIEELKFYREHILKI
ncbi:MAG: 3'-to-5' oligoribonuclease (orn) [uncultured Thiotrichaceae bacterium]|uniref:Oligoribonuclease n=1 Tax=uncultured Thiotrichaceae bacterium TaxID=298394 RepID=A0A6S6UGS9_9GAMM|nr:MAG: 3'-to-5' oligoribonuclease (orn) [uncultured Thiotrichaceae bacterium]